MKNNLTCEALGLDKCAYCYGGIGFKNCYVEYVYLRIKEFSKDKIHLKNKLITAHTANSNVISAVIKKYFPEHIDLFNTIRILK